jgi:uncharacterized protein YjbI with pentapeptide repeats
MERRPLDDLGLSHRNGRLDLSGLSVPEPTVSKKMRTAIADVLQLDGLVKIRGATLRSLDFSASRLNHLRFFDCAIEDCIFDHCMCQNWGLWGTKVSDTSFRAADLRKSALGGVQDGRLHDGWRNAFRKVDFTTADLRQTACSAAEFIDCTFKDTRLDNVDFQSSSFTNCVFEGELCEVLFYRRGFGGEAFPANEMIDVDFRRAKLRWVEFRGLDLETVRFPEDDDHIIVNDYPKTLDRLLEAFQGRTDLASRRLANVFAMSRKWAGSKQRRGVLNKNDLLQIGGEEGLSRVLEILASTSG